MKLDWLVDGVLLQSEFMTLIFELTTTPEADYELWLDVYDCVSYK